VVTRPAISLAQDRESSPARTGVLTTMLRNQLIFASANDGVTKMPEFWKNIQLSSQLCLVEYSCLNVAVIIFVHCNIVE